MTNFDNVKSYNPNNSRDLYFNVRSNKSLKLVRNKHKKPTSIFLTRIKLLFDICPLIQFAIFEEEPCQIEEEPCKCPSEEESIHFEEVCFRVYVGCR